MAARRVVVDGSNIATEGRTLPSLKQLNEAVLAFLNEYPETEVTVVVDATFGHRIDPAEVAEFEDAEANAEVVSPPAGAIGRGDAFLLRIAGKIGATVLSNDSFQEFHGEHEWLFEEGRLIGGKPVQGIGWIFTPRTPVRGMKSRKAVKEAKQKGRGPALAAEPTLSGEPLGPMPSPKKPPPLRKGRDGEAAGGRGPKEPKEAAKVAEAIATATEESVSGGAGGRKRRRKKRGARPAEPVNEAQPFLDFIEAHPLGSEVQGEVETFTSHGAFVMAGAARCYVPISALGDPPPRAARDVLNRGEHRSFVVQALDPQRRGIELALPEFAHVAGAPLPETIEAEISEAPAAEARPGRRRGRGASVADRADAEGAVDDTAAIAAAAERPAASDGRRRRAPAGSSAEAQGAVDTTAAVAPETAGPRPASRRKARGTANAESDAEVLTVATDEAGAVDLVGAAPGGARRNPAKAAAKKAAGSRAGARAATPAAPSGETVAAAPAKAPRSRKAAAPSAPSSVEQSDVPKPRKTAAKRSPSAATAEPASRTATTATKATKAAAPSPTGDQPAAPTPAKATKATKAKKAVKVTHAGAPMADDASPASATKATKAVKATKTVKKSTSAGAGATTPAKAAKATKAAKAAKTSRARKATPETDHTSGE